MTSEADNLLDEDELQALTARMEAKIATRRTQRAWRFPSGAREWALLAPAWTAALATAAGLLAGDDGTATLQQVAELLDRLAEAQLVSAIRTDPLDDGSTLPLLYVRIDSAYGDLLQEYLDRPNGTAELLSWVGQIGRGIADAMERKVDAPPTTALWARLAAAADRRGGTAEQFDWAVSQLLDKRDVNAVLNLKTAAEPLADLLTGNLDRSLELALQQTSRRLELLYREDLDRAHLRHFLDRPELTAAYRTLLDGRDEHWALHMVGAGGVGKTMFIRHVTADLARQPDFVTARIDFDYLSADYPVRAPSLLLWAFAQELLAYADEGLRSYFTSIELSMREFHNRLAEGRVTGSATADPKFRELVALYIDAFRALPGRLLLIVDTCEELARRYAAPGEEEGDEPETIRETFRILRALHDGPDTLIDDQAPPKNGLPSLRVILAGRWMLAGAGHEWRAGEPGLPARPFLRLYHLRGFTAGTRPSYIGEARNYLEREKVPEQLVAPIIKRVRERPPISPIVLADARSRRSPPHEWRCNPYDLHLYAEWARDESPLPEAILRTSPLQYIELRIIRRLKSPELVDVLPIVALLGHVDRQLLGAVAQIDRGAARALYTQLRRQEWMRQRQANTDVASDDVGRLDIDPPMRWRLLAYYQERPGNMQILAKSAAGELTERTLRSDLGALDWSIADATLRTLEYLGPERAAEWWQLFEARVLSARGPAWARRITEALIADEGAAGPSSQPADRASRLRPAVLALHAGALLHSGARGRVQRLWREVKRTASHVPLAALADRLAIFAQAGLISSARDAGSTPTASAARRLWSTIAELPPSLSGPPVAAALLAAAEALVERAEELAGDAGDREGALKLLSSDAATMLGPVQLHDRIAAALAIWEADDQAASAGLVAFAASIAARSLGLAGNLAKAAERCAQAVAAAPRDPGVWANWRAPVDLPARMALEQLRLLCPSVQSAAEALQPHRVLLSRLATERALLAMVDNDRLASALLRLQLAIQPASTVELETWSLWLASGRAAGPVPDAADWRAHLMTPPLLVTVAELLAGAGRIDEALTLLRPAAAGRSSDSQETERHAERALLHLVRHWRLDIRREDVDVLLKDSDKAADRELIWAAEALAGLRSGPLAAPPPLSKPALHAWLHTAWRTSNSVDRDDATAVVHWANANLLPAVSSDTAAQPSAELALLHLDLHEAAKLAQQWGLRIEAPTPLDPAAWWAAHPAEPEVALRLALRSAPPADTKQQIGSGLLAQLANRLGTRYAAEIAFEEGDLLKGYHLMTRLQVQNQQHRQRLGVTAQPLLPSHTDLEQTVFPRARRTVVHQTAIAALDYPAPDCHQPQVRDHQR